MEEFMAERDIQKEITASENKTYAYFNSVLCSLASGNFLLFIYYVIMSMTNTGIDTATDLPAEPDIKSVVLYGFIAFVCLLLDVFFVWRWFRRIRALEKKAATVMASLVLCAALIPILGYISLLIYGLIL